LELAKEEELIPEHQSDWFANTAGGDEDDAAAEGEEVSVGEVVVESEEEDDASGASSERSYELPMTQPFPEVPLMPFGTFKGARH
jgi:hypothetical protein